MDTTAIPVRMNRSTDTVMLPISIGFWGSSELTWVTRWP